MTSQWSFMTKRTNYPKDAMTEDRSGCTPMSGWLQKLSTKGVWQSR